jgi:hypothetical protein
MPISDQIMRQQNIAANERLQIQRNNNGVVRATTNFHCDRKKLKLGSVYGLHATKWLHADHATQAMRRYVSCLA